MSQRNWMKILRHTRAVSLILTDIAALPYAGAQKPGRRPGLFAVHSPRAARGFTVVELIATIVIVGIVAAVALPRFSGRHGFEARGFTDQVVASLQYARQVAIAQRRTVCAAFTGGMTLTLTRASTVGGACDRALTTPAGGAAYTLTAPAGVALAGADFTFDAQGRASAGGNVTINGGADGSFTVAVDAESGYVR